MRRHAGAVGTAFLLWLCCPPAFAGDLQMFVGTGVLNLDKSSFKPGPPPVSMKIVTTNAGEGKVTSDIQRSLADGTIVREVTTYASDGEEYVPSVMSPPADPPITFIVTQDDPRVIRIETRAGGKISATTIALISLDGTIQTGRASGTTPEGAVIDSVMVFEKK